MNCRSSSSRIAGFTLVELLTLGAVVAVLIGLVGPALAYTKSRTAHPSCLYQKRQLALAWQLYTRDYGDRVVNNFGVQDTVDAINTKRLDTWANNSMAWTIGDASGRSVTNLAWVRDGIFGKYTGVDATAYRCPADVYLSAQQKRAGYLYRVRSVAMNSLWGRFSRIRDSSQLGRNTFFPEYRQFLKLSDCPSPERTWVFLDEHPDSINDGYFLNNPAATSWGDIPASYHDGGAGIAFGDGHVELKRWASDRSKFLVKYMYPPTRPFDAAGKNDFQWLRTYTGYVRLDGTRMYGY